MGVKIINSTTGKEISNLNFMGQKSIVEWRYVVDCYDDYALFRNKDDSKITLPELLSVANKVKDKIQRCGIFEDTDISSSLKIKLRDLLFALVQVKSCADYDKVMNDIYNIADLPIKGICNRLLFINTVDIINKK